SFRAESLQALGLLPSSHTWICLSTILMDIPTFIDLPNLVYLSFSRNALSGPIPPSIGTLTKLVVLDLSFNGLNGSIPTSIGNCTKPSPSISLTSFCSLPCQYSR
uniref:Leucine-rich repeat-containing N-terminal plant-type domain-containing protein n=1 Tax=Aegilops tauschii subsp. strangulata TaxID=200361 RepID=A0A452XQV2_AEGTS